MIEFDAISLEGEVIWGKLIVDLKANLNSHVMTLQHVVSMFITAKQDPAFQEDFTHDTRETLYSRGDDDPYNLDLNKIVVLFENHVKPHLKRT